jgi:predicted porin
VSHWLWKRSAALVAALPLFAGVAYAQSASTPPPKDDGSLTYRGITLYGIVDIGLQYQTHGAPLSDYFPGGSSDIVQPNSNHSTLGATPSNLSQSRIGLQGVEPVFGDWSAVFRLETFFNPQSGEISDGLKSLVQNNGRSTADKTTGLDTSVAGQAFQQSYAGLSHKSFGTITFGRQNTLLADGVAKYDPNYASQAFSVIGLSGTTAGGGDTQDRRLDSSLKYVALFADAIHFGAQYKFSGATASANTAVEVNIGAEMAGASLDAYYVKVKDAISANSLSGAQVALLPGLGFSISNSLSATVSDNTSFSLMGMYGIGPAKLFAGYEHIQYANPSTPLSAGFDDIGGYKLAFVNNAAFPSDKILQVYWAGIRYTVLEALDLVGAYYGYHQNSYGNGVNAGCTSNLAATCSGTLEGISFDADYRLSKRFDTYAGIMFTGVHDGLANGYIHSTDMNPTIGVRYKF